ncbi:hypothetical protein [Paraburkholderia phytofirmans]|jgi:hypothetical protein|uniref:Transmembrane protein n=1 Tax=Paraburkholderia phytofirmans OLGA172 TaxID=1417228 RepID=A0A167VMW2_9BURK|nr:hypothetical protein [Paraburkholderia phytofirmans]ANB70948.1 hypothetical protein AYM40_00220 [Paraburkholderia phytofirmans OLGA172]
MTRSKDAQAKLRALMKRALIAYSGAVGIVVFALAISIGHGAGLKPLLILMPLFFILFGGVTYQLIKELRELKKNKGE